ncbi:MAG TPA: hypothetical protein VN939_15350 [Chthoniobacterales bacterium]|jgi:DNA-binding transcriptional regulator YiaG|nr:hypothetical protein [Chthoniobacterales bacterium]
MGQDTSSIRIYRSLIGAAERRYEERKKFAALMRKVEAIRLRYGISKSALAAELETTTDSLCAWMTGRKETVDKINDFLKRESV